MSRAPSEKKTKMKFAYLNKQLFSHQIKVFCINYIRRDYVSHIKNSNGKAAGLNAIYPKCNLVLIKLWP